MPDAHATAAIAVRLVYLARLREAFGLAGEEVSLARDDASLGSLLALLRGRGGSFARELAAGRVVRIAVNHDVVAADAPLHDGDEVALLPPVTGG
jgi:sulfur-carrier protein